MTSEDGRVAEALRWCRQVTRARARNFYYGLKLAPEPQRSAIYAVYAWMRRADDLVDDAAGDADLARKRITAFRATTDAALRGEPVDDDHLWRALAHTASRFSVDRAALHAMLDGQLDDVSGRTYATFEEVREYCYRVASTVGLVCIGIWGARDSAAPSKAVDRGIAFQLTNILRDYKEDYDAGRVYLPADDFERHGITPEGLRRWAEPDRCRAFVLEQVARARSFYERSAGLEGMITPSCRPTLRAMTAIYRGLLAKIERGPRRIVARRRLRLSSRQKAVIALRARWSSGREPALGRTRPAEA